MTSSSQQPTLSLREEEPTSNQTATTTESTESNSGFISSMLSFFSPSQVHADEGEAEPAEEEDEAPAAASEEEEEEEEPEDPAPSIRESCASSPTCAPAKHHFEECQQRVEGGKVHFHGENCVEELFHVMHCAESCAAPKIFSKLK